MGFMKFFFSCLFSFTPLLCVHTPSGDTNSNSYARAYVHPSITAVRVVFENKNKLKRSAHDARTLATRGDDDGKCVLKFDFYFGRQKTYVSTPLVIYSCFSYDRLRRRIRYIFYVYRSSSYCACAGC